MIGYHGQRDGPTTTNSTLFFLSGRGRGRSRGLATVATHMKPINPHLAPPPGRCCSSAFIEHENELS